MDLLSKGAGFTTMIGFHLFQDTVVSFNYASDAVLTGLVVVSSCSLEHVCFFCARACNIACTMTNACIKMNSENF